MALKIAQELMLFHINPVTETPSDPEQKFHRPLFASLLPVIECRDPCSVLIDLYAVGLAQLPTIQCLLISLSVLFRTD